MPVEFRPVVVVLRATIVVAPVPDEVLTPMAFAPVVLIVPVVAVIGAVAVVRLTALAPLVLIADPAAAFSVCAWSPVTVTPGTPTVGVITVSEFSTTVSGAAAT
jgi:hypothetical protein